MMGNFDEDSIGISIDLVEAARRQLAFLKEVDRNAYLYDPKVIRNAIRRYETCWLPLVAQQSGKEIAPPLDVHWIWHVHMLAPYFYEKDCTEIVNTVPDHMILSENAPE